METRIETITPFMAAQWLKTQKLNRPCSKMTVNKYSVAMKSGDWILNGESIKFSPDGVLIDGQHRLQAAVKANIAFPSLVVRGVNSRSFETLDTGKKRSLSDLLFINGYKDTNVLAVVGRLAFLHHKYGAPVRTTFESAVAATNAAVFTFINDPSRTEDLQEAAKKAHKYQVRGSFFSIGIAGYMWYSAHRADKLTADEFFSVLQSSVASDDPAAVLAERIAKMRLAKYRAGTEEALALCTKAWNAFAQNQKITQLRYRMVGPKAEAFPEMFGVSPDML